MVGYDFPNNPTIGQRVEVAQRVYQWNGKGWQIVATEFDPVIGSGGSGVWYVQDDKPVDAERGSGWLKCDEHAAFMNAGTKEAPIWVELGPEFVQAAVQTEFDDYGICADSFLTNGDFSAGTAGWTAYSSVSINDPALRIETTIGDVAGGVAINSPDGPTENILVMGPADENAGGWNMGIERTENLPAEFIGQNDVYMDVMARFSIHNHIPGPAFSQNDNVGVQVEAFDTNNNSLGQVFPFTSVIHNNKPPNTGWLGGGWATIRRFFGQVPTGTTYFKVRFYYSGSGGSGSKEFAIDKICPRCYRVADTPLQVPQNLCNFGASVWNTRDMIGIVHPVQDDWGGGAGGYAGSRILSIRSTYPEYTSGIPAIYISSTGYDNEGFGYPPAMRKPLPSYYRRRLSQGGNVNAVVQARFTAVTDNQSDDSALWSVRCWDVNNNEIQKLAEGQIFPGAGTNVDIGTSNLIAMYNGSIPANTAFIGFTCVSTYIRDFVGVITEPRITLS